MKPTKLLSPGTTNAKLSHNVMPSYILYLSPFNLNDKGINICPKASKECSILCLNTAGLGGIYKSIQIARRRKTNFMLEDRTGFFTQLAKELIAINAKGIKTAVRLNGTSDLDMLSMLKSFGGLDWTTLDNIQFYDYTKVPNRIKKYAGTNYDLTFSMSEINQDVTFDILKNGGRIAVVFDAIPATWKGYNVVNGDTTDERFKDAKNCIIGLKAKGKAKNSSSTFVIKTKILQDVQVLQNTA